jgi:hypothetical protein
MPTETDGFHAEDRKTLTRVEVEVEHIRSDLGNFGVRIARLEQDHVRISDLTDVRVDIDGLRDAKLDRDDVLGDSVREELKQMRAEIENLQRWRWFERGAVLAIITVTELIFRLMK